MLAEFRKLDSRGVCRLACGTERLSTPPPWLSALTEPSEREAARPSQNVPGHHRIHILPWRCCCILSDWPGETGLYELCPQ